MFALSGANSAPLAFPHAPKQMTFFAIAIKRPMLCFEGKPTHKASASLVMTRKVFGKVEIL